jgi:hypothetical protein
VRNAILTLLLFGLLAASADPAEFYGGLTMARLRGNAIPDAWADAGLSTGLLNYWAIRNSGTTVFDEWGTNTATAANGVLFGSAYGVRDDGAFFDGTNDYISCGVSGTFQKTNAITMAGWFKTTLPSPALITRWARLTSGGILTYLDAGRPVFAILSSIGGGISARTTSATITNNVLRHVVFTYDGSSSVNGIRIYIDGVDQARTTVGNTDPGTLAQTEFRLGLVSGNLSGVQYYGGSMDEVAIWSRALSSNEVYQIYNTPLYAPYKP